jgi:DNA-binding transcriptional MerR regulator
MDQFSISEMAAYSGVKVVTIRAWENRYGALTPTRSEGNTRYYSGEQLRRLLNIVTLLEANGRVSEVCSLNDGELFRRVRDLDDPGTNKEASFYIRQLIAAAMTYDEPFFSGVYADSVRHLGWKGTYQQVVYPLLGRMGLLWQCDTLGVAHEHFISNLLRQKICGAVDVLPPGQGETWMLCLPEGEFHELGLLVAHYLVRLSGRRSVYLGANLPMEAVAQAAGEVDAAVLLLFTVAASGSGLPDYLRGLTEKVSVKTIYIAGDPSKHLLEIAGIRWLDSLEVLLAALG